MIVVEAGANQAFKFIVTTYPLGIIYISLMASKKTTTTVTSKAPVVTPAPKGKHFDAKTYEKPGLTSDQVNDVKITFDLFDTDGTGSIEIKGKTDDLCRAQGSHGLSWF